MTLPTKRYQVWHHADSGFHFEEFDTSDEVAVRLCGDNPYGRVFVTELQDVSVSLYRVEPKKAHAEETL